MERYGRETTVRELGDTDDLAGFPPFLRSVSVVPAGIKYRDGCSPSGCLPPGKPGSGIDMIESRQQDILRSTARISSTPATSGSTAAGDFPRKSGKDGYIQLRTAWA